MLNIRNSGRLRSGGIVNYQGTYSGTVEYYMGDVVLEDGRLYISVTGTCSNPNLNNPPPNANWIPYKNTTSQNFISAVSPGGIDIANININTPAQVPQFSTFMVINGNLLLAFTQTTTSNTGLLRVYQIANNSATQLTIVPNASRFNQIDSTSGSSLSAFLVITSLGTNSNVTPYRSNESGALTSLNLVNTTIPSLTIVRYSSVTSSSSILAAVLGMNGTSHQIRVYNVNSSGNFENFSSTLTFGSGTINTIAISSQFGNNLYIYAPSSDGIVYVFQVNVITAALSLIFSIPIDLGFSYVSVSPVISGVSYLVIGGSMTSFASFQLFRIENTGNLTPLTEYSTGFSINYLDFSSNINGNVYLAVSNTSSNLVSIYSLDYSSGVLLGGNVYNVGNQPFSIKFSPLFNGNLYLSVVKQSGLTVSVYAVDPNTGVLLIGFAIINNFVVSDSNGFVSDGVNFESSDSGRILVNYSVSGTNSSNQNLTVYMTSNSIVLLGSNIGLNSQTGSYHLRNSFITDYTSNDQLQLNVISGSSGSNITDSTITIRTI